MKRTGLWALLAVTGALAVGACKRESVEPTKPPSSTAPLSAAGVDAGSPASSAADSGALSATDAGAAAPFQLQGRLAFIRDAKPDEHGHPTALAVLYDSATGKVRELTLDDSATFPATVSRDGVLALITSKGEEAAHLEQLYLMRTDAKASAVKVGPSSPRVRNPVFSPDGKRVVFESGHQSFSDLYSASVSGKELKRLTMNEEGNFEPSFSSDGSWLAFVSSRDGNPEIYRMKADGSDQSRLTISQFEEVAPLVSPDGGKIVFISNRGGDDRLYVMDEKGANPRQLNKTPVPPPQPGTLSNAGEREASWSPDGKQVAFTRREHDTTQRIWIATPEGSARAITPGPTDSMAAWSPDGRFLAFTSEKNKRASLQVVTLETGAIAPLLLSDTSDWRPLWVPAPTVVKR